MSAPTPYVSLYIARGQAVAIQEALRVVLYGEGQPKRRDVFRALLHMNGALYSPASPASDGPGETVPGAGEHGGHPEAPSPVSGGPSSGGVA